MTEEIKKRRGRPPKAVVSTPSGNHQVSVVAPSNEEKDDTQKMVESVKKEKRADKAKLGKNFDPNTTMFTYGPDVLGFVSDAVDYHFGLTKCNWRHGITEWNFPHSLERKDELHKIARWYSCGVYIDVFGDTKQEEIDRIKAHLEAMGRKYTYFTAQDMAEAKKEGWGSEEWAERLFGKRLDKVKVKDPVKVPTTMDDMIHRKALSKRVSMAGA